MKTLQLTLVGIALSLSAFASDQNPDDVAAVKSCLRNFESHPFNANEPRFRTMGAKVRVLGIGESSQDENTTEKPELVLVKPNVAVLTKNDMNLLNPNGWYCLKGQVSVLGKSEIHLHCKAKLASSRDGVVVLGAADHDSGVNVLGTTRLVRVGCPEKKGSTTVKTSEPTEETVTDKSPEKTTLNSTGKKAEKSTSSSTD